MKYDLYDIMVPEFVTLLGNMKGFLAKAEVHADVKKYDVNNLLHARLSPDQFALAKQVNLTCFLAEETFARATGKAAPGHTAQDQSFQDLQSRIDKALAYMATFKREEFEGWEERPMDMFFATDKFLPGNEYITQFAIPNFHFHVVTVYAILRHNGVELGKRDYIGGVNFREKKTTN